MERLSKHLGGPRLWIKRDDCTGLSTGGNKTRKLEFLLGDAAAKGADTLITQGATQSNHARQTAAAAAKFGMACHLLLEDRTGNTVARLHPERQCAARSLARRHGLQARGRRRHECGDGSSGR